MNEQIKRKRGRPSTGRPRRTHFVTFRIDDAERDMMRKAARSRGKFVARLAREAALIVSRKILESTKNTSSGDLS